MAALSRKRLVPRLLEPRLEQLRRDLRMIVADIRGERSPPWQPRDGTRYATTRRGPATRTLEISSLAREAGALSICLRPADERALPPLRPGQFLTLLWPTSAAPGAEVLRRAYSLSSDCRTRDELRLTIKRVPGGRVSQALYDRAELGMKLEFLGPSGSFGVTPEPGRSSPRSLVLIAGGSGITPMLAIAHTLLGAEANCEITLIYASRSHEQVIHGEELRELARTHAPRLRLIELYDTPPPAWEGPVGPPTPACLASLLDDIPAASDATTRFFLCGPPPMMDGADELLRSRGVAPQHIQRESFLPGQRPQQTPMATPQALTVALEGHEPSELGLVVQPGQTLLDAALGAGLPMPYSCTLGGCGACKVVLERGEVDIAEPNCLSEAERSAGQVLACVARPRSACRIRVTQATD